MKKDLVQLVYSIFVLVVSCAAEELLPPVFGVGVPVLLSASVYFALNRTPVVGLLFTLAAGAAEDSLSSLPLAASLSCFVVACALLRGLKLHFALAVFAYPLYQLWIWAWLGSAMQGRILIRILAAFPVGAVTSVAVWALLRWLDGKAAVDEK